MAHFWLSSALLCVGVRAQERGDMMTCWDRQQKCNLDCIMPKYREGVQLAWPFQAPDTEANTDRCTSLCTTEAESCVDSDETEAYIDCAFACATDYDGSLMLCTQKASSTTIGTYNKNQDSCSNKAAGVMDTCMDACAPTDRFGGWTPEKEEGGGVVRGITDETWRSPFLSDEVVFGSGDGSKTKGSSGEKGQVAAAAAEEEAEAVGDTAAAMEQLAVGAFSASTGRKKTVLRLDGQLKKHSQSTSAPGAAASSSSSELGVVGVMGSATLVGFAVLASGFFVLNVLQRTGTGSSTIDI